MAFGEALSPNEGSDADHNPFRFGQNPPKAPSLNEGVSMGKLLLAGLGAALVLIGSCSTKPEEAMGMAEEAYAEASSAKSQIEELELRIQEIESRLNI